MALVALGSHRGGTVVAAPDYWLFVCHENSSLLSRLLGLGLTLVVEVIVADWCWCSSITGSGIRPGGRCSAISPPCQRQGREASRRILAGAVSAL